MSALVAASSTLAWASLHWASSSFLSLSRAMAASCSALSSSASLAASIIVLWALSSDILASPIISSRLAFREHISCSHLSLAPQMAWFWQVRSLRLSLVSASSCSTFLLVLSLCSSKVLASSSEFLLALARLKSGYQINYLDIQIP